MSTETAQAIPQDINLTKTKPAATPAYARRFQSLPANASSFAPGQNIQIIVDTSTPGSYIDPHSTYLEFDVVVSGTTGARCVMNSAGWATLFEDFRIYVQSVVIEEIRTYNLLAAFLNDMHGQANIEHQQSYMMRDNEFIPTYLPEHDYGAIVGGVFTGAEQTPTGGPITDNFIYHNVTYRVQMPIISGVLGTMAEKAFPAMLLAPGTLMLEFRLATLNRALQTYPVTGNTEPQATNYTITNCRFVGKQIILTDAVSSAIIDRSANGDIGIHTQSYRNAIVSISPGSTGDISLLCNMRISSANSIYFIFRDSGNYDSLQFNTLHRLPIGFCNKASGSGTTAQLRIGNDFVPQTAIQSSGEAFIELLKAHHFYGDLRAQRIPLMGKIYRGLDSTVAGNNATWSDYDACAVRYGSATTGGVYSTFVLGFDLDTFTRDNNLARCGRYLGNNTLFLQLSGMNIPAINAAEKTPQTVTTNPTAVRVDFYVLHDVRLSFQSGGVVVASY